MPEFVVGEEHFELDGRPVRLLSGAVHYFRVPEAYWAHRLAMVRAMGLNCVETYVPWNLHQPRPDRWEDVGAVGRFLDAVRAAGLWAIVRPGPYICAEWENGGLPHWLTGALGNRVRTGDPEYLAAVERWFGPLLEQVVPRQVSAPDGGPVLMVQVENEYGSYGSDQGYLRWLAGLLRRLGVSVPLFTSDGPEDHMLTGGSLPGVPATVNFGSGAREAFAALRRHRPSGPLMCMEFWCGWFDHWGAEPVARDPAETAAELAEVLECGASVNLYMAHGGTSFGGWAGANRSGADHTGALLPTVTSYDYRAPVDEWGWPTELFRRFREVLARFGDGPPPEVPAPPPVLGRPVTARLSQWVPLPGVLAALGDAEVAAPVPPTFEELDVDRGVVRYRLEVPGPRGRYPLWVRGLRDRAVVYVDGERRGVLTETEPVLEGVAGPAVVELWVESLGRVNYGPRLGEPKGITGGVLHERQYLHGVRARALRPAALDGADAVAGLPFEPWPGVPEEAGEGLYRGWFEVSRPGDAGLRLPGWTRGFAWVNGFCLGRYRSVGPQRTLYVPGPVLREGRNKVLLLELEGAGAAEVHLSGRPGTPPGPAHAGTGPGADTEAGAHVGTDDGADVGAHVGTDAGAEAADTGGGNDGRPDGDGSRSGGDGSRSGGDTATA